MAETFALPRSSFKLLRLILIGYLHEGGKDRKPSGPSSVGKAIGLDQTLVSRNNAALASLGLLESAENRRWRLTEGGETVARALEYEAYEDAEEPLAEVLRSSEFVRRVVTFVRAQGGVDADQLTSHIARTAGVKKTSEFLTGARALLELLYISGLVEQEGDVVRVPAPREAQAVEKPAPKRAVAPGTVRPTYGAGFALEQEPAAARVTLHLNLSPADLKTDAAADKLAARIKRLLDALATD